MLITIFRSKIHRATVTDANLNYEGSITIDSELMKQADLVPNEKVHVADINNGERFETYVIPGAPGSGQIIINGAAARKVHIGDLVIIIAYAQIEKEKAAGYTPVIVHVDARNRAVK
ncbi:MAG: aspartate 1-decarboxylase [candidate division Zixibacteria bacterium]|nr:aspartate 1-decarboxylase [candidate division Zixibacteria bacterium]